MVGFGPVEVIATRSVKIDVEVDRWEEPILVVTVGMPKVSERGRPVEMPVAHELLRPLNLLFLSLVSISEP
jgi:hypothetical protein